MTVTKLKKHSYGTEITAVGVLLLQGCILKKNDLLYDKELIYYSRSIGQSIGRGNFKVMF